MKEELKICLDYIISKGPGGLKLLSKYISTYNGLKSDSVLTGSLTITKRPIITEDVFLERDKYQNYPLFPAGIAHVYTIKYLLIALWSS